jgi:hypothetical protein
MGKHLDIIDSVHAEAASLLRDNIPDEEIIRRIIGHGVEQFYAETVLENVKQDRADKISFRKHILYGSALVAMGFLLNFASRLFYDSNGSMYYLIFLGPAVAGVLFILRGIIIFRK